MYFVVCLLFICLFALFLQVERIISSQSHFLFLTSRNIKIISTSLVVDVQGVVAIIYCIETKKMKSSILL